jgi:hypothetical protein
MPGGAAATVFLTSRQNPRLKIRSDRCSSEQHWPYLEPLPLPRSSLGSGRLPEHHQLKRGAAMPATDPSYFFSTRVRLTPKMSMYARDTGTQKALTLCPKFREHFIDSAVYLAGASQWITDSARNWTEDWRKPVGWHWNLSTPSPESAWLN